MKVVKPQVLYKNVLDQFCLGSFSNNTATDPYPLGKVSLSVKKGKKRVLVNGTITCEPYDCKYNGLSWDYYFVPRSPIQAQKLEGVT